MTVKELIKELQKCVPDDEVAMRSEHYRQPIALSPATLYCKKDLLGNYNTTRNGDISVITIIPKSKEGLWV